MDSEYTFNDHLGLSFKITYLHNTRTNPLQYYYKTEWEKVYKILYEDRLDEILTEIKVPFQLLLHGVRDSISLDIYAAEIFHAMKCGEAASVPVAKVKRGSRKFG